MKTRVFRSGLLCLVAAIFFISAISVASANPLHKCQPTRPPGQPDRADLILYNGKVITVDEDFSIAQAVAVKDGKFIAVGKNAEVTKFAGPQTKMINLHRKTVIPGLIDSHLHQLQAATDSEAVQLIEARSISDVAAIIGAAVAAASPGAVIAASSCWHEGLLAEKRLPTRWDLDPVSPNNPVIIPRGGHVITCNSKALEMAGINASTPNPPGGTIVKDPLTGEPTGVMWERATAPVKALIPAIPYDRKVQLLKEIMQKFNSYGITGISEPGISGDDIRAYMDVWKSNEMTVRSSLMYRMGKLDDVKFATTYYAAGFGDDMMRFTSFKFLGDGGVEGGRMYQPYQIVPGEQEDPNYHGYLFLPPGGKGELDSMLSLAAQRGWQVQIHCVGDEAVDTFVDAYERANAVSPIKDLRWAIMHIFLPSQQSLNKMKQLGIIATCQDHPSLLGSNQVRYWGNERAERAIPLRTLLDNGIIFGGGTDAPVVPYDPFLSLWWMVTRNTLTAGVLGPEQAITRQEALRAYTIYSAYTQFMEDKVGSIEPGKLADLVVLSDDILTCAKDSIKDIKVLTTIVDGEIVYEGD